MSFFGDVLGGIVGGIFGKKKKSTETVRSEVDYVKLRDSAEKAGFNPLTALRNGGSAGFTVTHKPVLSVNPMLESIGKGLQNGIQAAFDYNPLDEEKSRLELKLMEAQLRRINESAGVPTRLGAAPTATGLRTRTNGYTSKELAVGPKPKPGDVSVTNPIGGGWVSNPNVRDAEMAETRWGDIGQEIYGAFVGLSDLWYNAVNHTKKFRVPYDYANKNTQGMDNALGRNVRGRGRDYRTDVTPSYYRYMD